VESYAKFSTGFIELWGGRTVGVDISNPFYPETFPEGSHFNITESLPFGKNDLLDISNMKGVESVFRIVVLSTSYALTEDQLQKLREKYSLGIFPEFSENVTSIVLGIDLVGVEAYAAQIGSLSYANIEKGRFLQPEDANAAVIRSLIEEDLGFTVDGQIPLRILNQERNFRIVGVFSGPPSTIMETGYTVAIDLDELFSLLGATPEQERYNVLLVKVKELSDAETIISELRKEYPKAQVYYRYSLAKTSIDLMSSAASTYSFSRNLLLVTSAVMVVLIRLLDLLRNRQELGLYMAVGWKNGYIVKYMLWNSIIIGLIGTTVGILFSVATGEYFLKILVPKSSENMLAIHLTVLDPVLLLQAFLVVLTLSALSFVAGYLYYQRLTIARVLEGV
jgi:ABC-type antimicrobial peptide transport system permease subunit